MIAIKRVLIVGIGLSAVLGAARPASAGSCGFLVPPVRLDASPMTMTSERGATLGSHFLVGLHWASVSPNPRTPLDIGIGYFYEGYGGDGAGGQGGDVVADKELGLEGDVVYGTRTSELHGAYIEASRRLAGTKHQRSWLGIRGELLFAELGGRTYMGAGATGRVAWEALTTVKEGGSGGGVIGALAIGGYLEVGVRRLPEGVNAVQTTAGLSVRLPFLVIGG